MVGVEGFELSTSSSQSWRSTRLSYTPPIPAYSRRAAPESCKHGFRRTCLRGLPRFEHQPRVKDAARRAGNISANKKGACSTLRQSGAPGEIRTPDHQVRSLVLYPAELRARRSGIIQGDAIFVNPKRATKLTCERRECWANAPIVLAEREGFEPSIELLTLYSLSRGAPSASRAPLRFESLV